MTKIEAIVRPEKVEEIIAALDSFGHSGLTKLNVEGHGKQKGLTEYFRGKEYILPFTAKTKIEVIVHNDDAEKIVDTICDIANTGKIGDGKIFISEVKDVIRVRTKERGEATL